MEPRISRAFIQRFREHNLANRIIRTYRRFWQPRTIMAPFITNPYDAILVLTSREDHKLFQEGLKGLKEADKLSGKNAT